MNIQEELFAMQDLEYKAFHAKLMPTVPPERIIGIRVPVLRKFAKAFAKTEESRTFLACLPHEYYEENNLHAFVAEQNRDFDTALAETERFLPYIDNWATCDMFFPKVFAKNPQKLLPKMEEWLESEKPYTVRYAIGLFMRLCLDEDFLPEYLERIAKIRSEEYYVNMMIAWFFATALAKQYDAALPYITEQRLDIWTHNKAIQKAVESNRIPKETKEYLKTLKIKG